MSQNPVIPLPAVLAPLHAAQSRRTKIVCTMGPSCWDPPMLVKMIKAGMNTARLNFSHGDHEGHARTLANLNAALSEVPESHVAVMLDTKGPEIRTGYLENGDKVTIERGSTVELTTDYSFKGTASKLAISYEKLPSSVQVGSPILVADGSLVLRVTEILPSGVMTVAECQAVIGQTKNVNLPGCIVDLPTVTERDIQDIQKFGLAHHVDYIAASFIRKGSDIDTLRSLLGDAGKDIQIIAKIENEEGLENYDEILTKVDGIMVARGDLGMEIPLEKVILAQKMMIQKANAAGKPVINATQMMESMISKPRPTRAECADVCNAILDGADSVMLSGESANGQYPVETVEIMAKICVETESIVDYSQYHQTIHSLVAARGPMCPCAALCSSAVQLSRDVNASAIVLLTDNVHFACKVAQYKPQAPIYVCSHKEEVVRVVSGYVRGAVGVVVPQETEKECALEAVKKQLAVGDSAASVVLLSSVEPYKCLNSLQMVKL